MRYTLLWYGELIYTVKVFPCNGLRGVVNTLRIPVVRNIRALGTSGDMPDVPKDDWPTVRSMYSRLHGPNSYTAL